MFEKIVQLAKGPRVGSVEELRNWSL